MKNLVFILPITLLLCFMVGCKEEETMVERSMEEGVEVIVNHLEPYTIKGEASQLYLDEEFIIDLERDDLAVLGITGADTFDVDSDGNIYFVIRYREDNKIFKFNRQGKFESSFGRGGQGPGELQEPQSFRINSFNQLIISDYRRKICIFNENEEVIQEIKLDPKYRIATLLKNGKILVQKPILNQEEGMVEYQIILCSSDLEETQILQAVRRRPNISLAKKINPLEIYYYDFLWVISKELIYIGNYRNEYEILIYDTEGNLIRKIRKEYDPVPVPSRLQDEILDRFEKHPMNEELKLKEKVDFPKSYPPYQFFFVDEENRLFVMTFEKGEGPKDFICDIFNPDGVFVGRMVLDNCGYWPESTIKIPLKVVAKNKRLYYLREKENGYKELVVYRLRWE